MEAHKLRPHAYLYRRGVGAIVAFFTPAFAILFFLTVPNGPWWAVIIAQVVVTALSICAVISYRRLGVWVSADSITERGFFGITRRYSREQLGSTVFANTYHGGGVETVPQLFICDPAAQQIVRLRGQFWSLESMQTIMSTLELPLTEIDKPVTTQELSAMYPGLLYWFERRPILAAVVFAGVLVVGGATVYALLAALGATIR